MRLILTNKLLLLIVLVLSSTLIQAQGLERLYDLNVNHRLSDYEKYVRSEAYHASRAVGDTLDLPFFDDFSEPFTRLRNLGDNYPDSDKWIGNQVYINNHYAINPISQGVATFDALDERGQAYSFGSSLPAPSDTLRSKPLNMGGFPADSSVWLSFYYQPQGLGNAPEDEDVLVLQFKDTADSWETVWEAEGSILEVFDFERAMVAVSDSAYLFDGFQFQFVNYASRSGSVDHWHIDYVELDDGRSINDTIVNDVVQLGQTSYLSLNFEVRNSSVSLLKNYSAMPWEHYKADSIESMGDTCYTAIRNNRPDSIVTNFSLQLYDHTGDLRYDVLSRSAVVYPGLVCDNVVQGSCNDGPVSSSNLLNRIDTLITSFPTDTELSEDSTYFEVHLALGVSDGDTTNNLLVEKQEFYNYYAYDDGTAEAAYGLGELENVGRVAVKYEPTHDQEDYIRAIQLYLNPVEFDLSLEQVQLAIWDGGETPNDTLWTSEPLFLNYTDYINYFYHYQIDREVAIQPGQNVWVGWIQQPATNQKFSVGFDKRADNSDKVFFNLGTIWNQSSIPGSVMIRPVFGEEYDWVSTSEEEPLMKLNVFPNPSDGTVYFQEQYAGQLTNARVQIFDLFGRIVHQQTGSNGTMQLSHLKKGMYLLRVDSENAYFTDRLILQ